MKNYIGIDIGTTTVSFTVIDASDNQLYADNFDNSYTIENLVIFVKNKLDEILSKYSISAIGVTGQMHGILLLDKDGKAVSELYNWQSDFGNRECKGSTYSKVIQEITGYNVPTGYGFSTLFYLNENSLIPDKAKTFCTVADYVVMSLTKCKVPLIHLSNAASLGLYDLQANSFDYKAIEKLNLPLEVPNITAETICCGNYNTIPVSVAIGDNQASYLGAAGQKGLPLINCGTGSQISIESDSIAKAEEVRPYINGKYLLVGSALCGGASYALIERFFRSCMEVFGNTKCEEKLWEKMNTIAREGATTTLKVNTRFNGTRKDPGQRGSIENVSLNNFSPASLIYATLSGMADELYSLWQEMDRTTPPAMYASGNAVKKNSLFVEILENKFKTKITVPSVSEEAAFGAAVFSKMI